MKKVCLALAAVLVLGGCWKPLNLEQNPIPGNTLALEFASKVGYVIDLKIDGQTIPIRYTGANRILWVEGLTPGEHTFTINSISYVFGPEVGTFNVTNDEGSFFFVQSRKYRSSTPKNRAQLRIRAYRRQLRKVGIDVKEGVTSEGEGGKIRAFFTSGR